MSFTQDLFTSRRNYNDGSTRLGQEGRIWYDPISNSFRISDGNTVGGVSIGVAEVHASGIGLTVNQHTGNVTITSNATSLAIPNTIVSRNSSNATFLENLTSNILVVTGNLTVLGNTKFVDQQLLSIQNKTLTLANTTPAPSDFAANGGGLILLGTSNHTILWDQVSASWESSENWNLIGNKFYSINNIPILTINSVLDTIVTANLAVAGTNVRIGAATGNTTVRNNLHINGNLTVDGSFPIRRDYDYLNFYTTLANPVYLEGRLFYDNTEKSLAYYADNTELTLNIGQETVFRATNKSGITLYSGNVVYISGAIGDRPTVARALANNFTASQAIGVVTTTIANNDTGYVTLNGVIHNVNTAGMTDGDILYLSPTLAGAFTTTKPQHPNFEVRIGYVTRVNANNGHFVLAIRNAAFDQLMVNGPANFQANVTVDQNLTITGHTTLSGNLSVAGATVLANARVSNLTSGRLIIAGTSGSLADSTNLTFNTGTNTLTSVNAILSGTLSAGATTLNSATVTNSLAVGTTLAVTGAATLTSTLSAGASTLSSLVVTNGVSVGTTLAVTGSSTFTGTSSFTGDVTAINIDSATLDTSGAVTVGGSLNTSGNLIVNNDRLVVNAATGNVSVLGTLFVGSDTTVAGTSLNLPATFNIGPTTTDLRIGNVFGTTRVRNNLEVDGDVMIDGGYLNASTIAFNLLNTTSTIVNAFGAATSLALGSFSGTTNVRNNLLVDNNLTVGGGTFSVTTSSFSLANSVATSVDAFGSAQTINIGSIGGKLLVRNSNVELLGNLQMNGGSITTNQSTFNFVNSTANTVNIGGAATTVNIAGEASNTNIFGNLEVRGGNITTNQTTFNLLDATATIINFAGSSTVIRIGAATGNLTIRNTNTVLDGSLEVKGGAITTNQASFNLINTNASTVNIAGAATTINLAGANSTTNLIGNLQVRGQNLTTNQTTFNLLTTTVNTLNIGSAAGAITIGATTGSLTVRNTNTILDGTLQVKGGAITTNQTSFDLVNATATTVNVGGSATTLNLGSTLGSGTTNILNNLYVTGNLLVNGTNVTFNSAVSVVNDPVMIIGGSPPAAIDDNKDRGIQFTWHTGTAARTGFFGYDDSQQVFTFIPDSTNTGEVFTGIEGAVKFGSITGTTGTFSGQVDVQGDLLISNGRLTSSQSTVNLIDTSTTINLGAAATNINLGVVAGNTNTLGNLQVRGGSITTTQTLFNLLDATATTVNFAGSSTVIRIGAATGSLTIRNTNTVLDGSLEVKGGAITTNQASFNLINTTASTVNLAGAATTVNIAGAASTTNIIGSLEVRGGSITTNQTTFNLLDSTATTVNLAGAATAVRIGAATGSLNIRNTNTVLDGSLEVKGGTITTNQTTFNLVNVTATTVNLAGAATTVNIAGAASNTNIIGSLEVRGGNITTNQTTFNLLDSTATTVNMAGAATTVRIGAATGNLTIRNINTVLDGSLEVKGGSIITNQASFNLINTTATTVNLAGAATTLNIAGSNSATNVLGNLEVRGQNLTSTQTIFNLLNNTVNTLNIGASASTVNLGAVGGTLTIRNDTVVVDGDLQVKGGDLTTNLSAFNIINTNAIAVNAFGAAVALTIGASSGVTNIRNSVDIDGTLNVDGATLSTSSSNFSLLNTAATNVAAFGAATLLTLGAPTGTTTVRNKLNLNNDLDVLGSVNIDNNLIVDGAVNIDGAVDIDNSLDVLTNLNVGNNLTVVGTVTIGSPGFNSTSLTFNLLNTYTTLINAFGAATLVEIGSTLGKTSVNNELEVEGAALSTSRATFDLVNTTATTLNFAGAASTLTVGATSGTTRIRNNLDIDGTLNVDGGVITVSGAALSLADSSVTTVNAFGAATTLTVGATSGTTSIRNNVAVSGSLTVGGDLTVNGTLTTLNSVTLTVDDKNIELGSVTTPTDSTADGGGITLRGTTQKTINWVNATTAWTSSEHFDLASTKEYRINNVLMLSSTTLGASVVNSSLTTVGTIGTGVWQGTVVSPTYGGTGVNNGSRTITLGGNFATAGNFNLTLVLTAASTITLPITGTVATLAGTETLTNKSINLANNTLTGTVAEFNTALSGADFATLAGIETLTNKTVNLTNNTLLGTRAQFDTACTDDNFGYTGSKLSQFAATSSSELAGVITDETGSGALVFSNSPILVTPTLGVASATSINKVAITTPATAATLTIANNKTLTVSNTLTFTSTDASSVAFGTGGTVAYTANKLNVFAATSSSEFASIITDYVGTGNVVLSDSPTLVSPTLGNASATSVSISSVINLTPLSSAPPSPTTGMIAVADHTNWDPNPGGAGAHAYPVFYANGTWHRMI